MNLFEKVGKGHNKDILVAGSIVKKGHGYCLVLPGPCNIILPKIYLNIISPLYTFSKGHFLEIQKKGRGLDAQVPLRFKKTKQKENESKIKKYNRNEREHCTRTAIILFLFI